MFSSGVVSVPHFPLAARLSQRQMFLRDVQQRDFPLGTCSWQGTFPGKQGARVVNAALRERLRERIWQDFIWHF